MNPQKETEKAVKRAEKTQKGPKATYAPTNGKPAPSDWHGEKNGRIAGTAFGTEWRYQLAVRQVCRAMYRSIRSDYLEQLRVTL